MLLADAQPAQRSANAEAVNHVGMAAKLLEALPATPGRQKMTFASMMALAFNLSTVKGIAASEVGDDYVRANELCDKEASSVEYCDVLIGLRVHHAVRGDVPKSLDYAEILSRTAAETNIPELICQGLVAEGIENYSSDDRVQESGRRRYLHRLREWTEGFPGSH
ncbi:MAG: hypothetical protein EXR86_13370 [Gammaproteobacteria bacterium]|nr:hypothetical protein [Gammaproteobacteria bacterium]